MRHKGFLGAIAFVVLLSLSACQGTNRVDQSTSTAPSVSTATQDVQATAPSAKGSLGGKLLSAQSHAPLVTALVRLAKVHRQNGQGAFVLDSANSPGTFTQGDGSFSFESVEPGEYVLVIGDPATSYAIVADPSGQPRVWKVESNQRLDIGSIEADYPPS